MIPIVTTLFGGAAVAYSLSQQPTYQAETSLRFVDTAADADLVGATAIPRTTPTPESPSSSASNGSPISPVGPVIATVRANV